MGIFNTISGYNERGFKANATLGSTFTERSTTATRPASIANESVVIGCAGFNHVDILPYSSASGGTAEGRLIGWSVSANGVWKPEVLFEGTFTFHTVASSDDATLYPAVSVVANQGSKNTSEVNSNGYKAPMSLIIDLRGCTLFEWGMTASGSPTANFDARLL